ncbi:MAG: hypothetical protein ACRD2C_19405 [Acidimicrobiales bacterium]
MPTLPASTVSFFGSAVPPAPFVGPEVDGAVPPMSAVPPASTGSFFGSEVAVAVSMTGCYLRS